VVADMLGGVAHTACLAWYLGVSVHDFHCKMLGENLLLCDTSCVHNRHCNHSLGDVPGHIHDLLEDHEVGLGWFAPALRHV
jgi:hypothetical protein